MYQDRPAATEVCTRLNHTARSRLRPALAAEAAEAHDGTVRRVVLTGLHRLQLEQRNHPACLGLVFADARRRGGDLVEERVALGGRQLAGGHVERVGADLHLCPRVGPQVVHPGRVEGGAGERSDDDQLAVVAEIRQRRHPGLARFGPRRRQQQQIRVGELAAHLAFVGPEVVDDALVERVDGLGVGNLCHARSTFSGAASIPDSLRCCGVMGAGASVSGSTPPPVLGNAITSRIESTPDSSALIRSQPNAMPPCGGAPNVNASNRNPTFSSASALSRPITANTRSWMSRRWIRIEPPPISLPLQTMAYASGGTLPGSAACAPQ